MKRVRNIFLFVALFAVVFAFNVRAGEDPLKEDLDKAVKTQDKGLIEKSIKAFDDLCKKDEKDYMAHYWAAKSHYAMADYLDLQSPEDKDKSGEAEKHVDEAMDHLKKSLDAKEDFLDGYILKYLCLSKKFNYVGFPRLMMYVGEINETLDKAMKIAPENPWANFIKGLNIANGFPKPDPKEPIAQFEKVLKLDPKIDDAYYQIALIYIGSKNTDEAKKNLQKALEINPSNHWAKKKLSGLEQK